MNIKTQEALLTYICSLREEGFDTIHVSEIIPSNPTKKSQTKWTQFPDIDDHLLIKYDIIYSEYTGWFSF